MWEEGRKQNDVWFSCLNNYMVGILTGKRKTDREQVCNSKNFILQVLSLQLVFEHPMGVVK